MVTETLTYGKDMHKITASVVCDINCLLFCPTPGAPAIPNRKEGFVSFSKDCFFSLARSLSAIYRLLLHLLSTNVIALDNAILLFIPTLLIISVAKLSTILSMFL